MAMTKESIKAANEALKEALMPGMDGINTPRSRPDPLSEKDQAKALEAIEAGANPNLEIIPNGPGALCCAVAMGADLVVKALLERGADLEERVRPYRSRSTLGYTALGLAAEKAMGGIAKDLCEAGADPMALIPTFEEGAHGRKEPNAPILWTMIFSGLGDAIEAAAPRVDWAQKAPGPGVFHEVKISYFTLAAVLSRNALGALVRSGLDLPKNFFGELQLIRHGDGWGEAFLAEFAIAQRGALEKALGGAGGEKAEPDSRKRASL